MTLTKEEQTIRFYRTYAPKECVKPDELTPENALQRINNRTIYSYEYFTEDTKTKIYFDCDYLLDDEHAEYFSIKNGDQLAFELRDILKTILSEIHPITRITIATNHRQLTTGKNKGKYKYSIRYYVPEIISRPKNIKYLVKDINAIFKKNECFMNEITDRIGTQNNALDENPYMATQKLRCVNTPKVKGEPLLVLLDGRIEDTIISGFFHENAFEYYHSIPEKPVKATTSPSSEGAPSAEGITKNRAILEKGMHLLKKYAGSGEYANWTRIIWAIKNLTNDKNLAMTFSKLDKRAFDETSFDNIWDNAEVRDNSLGINSIINFMKETDIEATKRILNEVKMDTIREEGLKQLQNAINREGVDNEMQYLFEHSPLKNGIFDKYVAQHFHMVFKNKIITVRESTYVYNGIFWELSDKTHSAVQVLISGEFINHLNKFWDYVISKYSDERASTIEEDKRKAIQLKINEACNFRATLAGKLMTQFGRKDYLKEIILYSIDNDIEFDQKANLFVFKNCIFDLITQKKVEPKADDYMSICCGYDYDDKYDKELEKELLSVIKSIHQNEEIFEYFMTVMATSLTSEHLQYFIILTGKGGNGKGLLMKLYNTMLGEYAYTLPVQVLLNDIKLGPNPEVANMNGKRLCSTSEPKKGERIRSSTMKALTGERTIGARKLQSNDCKTVMNNTLIMEVNEFAGFDETGDAITRRVRSIPFLSSAVSKSEYEQAENKTNLTVKNTSYDTEEWRVKYRQALFNISLPFLGKFYELGKDLPEMPKACFDKTNAHLALSDDLHLWIKELYTQDEDNYEIVPLKNLYDVITKNDAFRELPKNVKRQYKYSYFCDKMQENKTMRDFVVEKDKRYKNSGVHIKGLSLCGWRLKTAEDE